MSGGRPGTEESSFLSCPPPPQTELSIPQASSSPSSSTMSLLMDYVFVPAVTFARYCAGFSGKTARVDEFEWSYMERDAQAPDTTEPVVLVHGFSSWKESWTNLARQIDKKYRVIVPDLPGQGCTTPAEPTLSYTADAQAERLHRFLEETVPADRKVHLIGCSMGGMLAGVYSAKYPERVRSLTMMCPAGITMPNKSDAYKILDDEGRNLLLARTPEEMAEMAAIIDYRQISGPRFILSSIVKFRLEKMPVFEKIFEDTKNDPTVLESQLDRIRAKTLIFWGKNDRVLDVSSLPILEQKLVNVPQKFAFVFDECGHTVQHEKTYECVQAINQFLDGETPRV